MASVVAPAGRGRPISDPDARPRRQTCPPWAGARHPRRRRFLIKKTARLRDAGERRGDGLEQRARVLAERAVVGRREADEPQVGRHHHVRFERHVVELSNVKMVG